MVFNGNRIKLILEEKRISQNELHRRTGISQSYISDLINNKRIPHTPTLAKIAEALGVGLDDFMDS